jgi:hypothetical protein
VIEINWHLNQIIINHLAMSKFDGSKMLEYIWVLLKLKLMKKFVYNFLFFFPIRGNAKHVGDIVHLFKFPSMNCCTYICIYYVS